MPLAAVNWQSAAVEVASNLANPHMLPIIVCDGGGVAIGVIARTDIVRLFSRNQLDAFPMLGEAGRPVGIVHARDAVRPLLDEVSHEEILLEDCVSGVRYR